MRIVIASGKGGAGKTTVTACLAGQWAGELLLADADVEAPNLHLLLHPDLEPPEPVFLEVPELAADICTGCGACRPMCAYGAIAMLGAKPVYFQDMCHGCGGCFEVCPEQALRVAQRELGALLQGSVPAGSKTLPFLMGRTRVGEAMTTACATCARRGIGLFSNKTILLGNYAKTLPLQARERPAKKQMFQAQRYSPART